MEETFIMIIPKLRTNFITLNIACVLMIIGIWIDKGMGLIVPAFIPTPLGEIVEYTPTLNEILVCTGIWAGGLLLYTILVRITVPVLTGRLTIDQFPEPDSVRSASQGDLLLNGKDGSK